MSRCYTKHACKRFKQRYGSEEERYDIKEIKKYGYIKEDFRRGSGMDKYLKKKEAQKEGSTAYLYKSKVFIVVQNTVITTWGIPEKFLQVYDI